MNRATRQSVLLAYPAEERRLSSFPSSFPCQRKLKGRRAIVRWVEEIPILLSSYGHPIQFMEHIQGALLELPMVPWDGELYVHGWTQEQINGVTKRTAERHPDSLLVEYHIFDVVADPLQEQRIKALDMLLPSPEHPIYKVETEWTTQEGWVEKCSQYLREGYEGIMLRHPSGKYISQSPAYRSPHLLKYKPTETDKYRIVGYKEGEGWAEGMLGAFLVTSGEEEFFVGTGPALTKPARARLWRERSSLVGKNLLVKHEPTQTVGGVPICTVAVEVVDGNS